jgi:hypothetical protein
MSLAKARHFDGAEMDIDLRFDMDSLNFYLNGTYPQQIGMQMDTTGPTAGPTGELHAVGLN